LAGHAGAERRARVRELRALATVYFGPGELKDAFDEAVGGECTTTVDRALRLLAAAPSIRRRRTLARFRALLR
jgi:hypothetical protein